MRPALVRTIALDVFARVMHQGELADRALHRALRAHAELHSTERRYVSTAVYGMIRLHRRYDYLLEAGLARARLRPLSALATPDADRLRYAAVLVTELGETPESAVRLAGESAPLKAVLEDLGAGRADWPADPIARLAVEGSLPDWAARRLSAEYGSAAGALAKALNARAPLVLRANLLKTTIEQLQQELRKEGVESTSGTLSPWAVVLEGHHNVFGLAAYKAGLFDVQDEGLQLIALSTGAEAGQHVMDACCGAGGKTLALAAMMRNKGLVIASDVSEHRMEDLKPRAKLAGAFNLKQIVVAEGPGGDSAVKGWRQRADVVLIDAPCSGTGAWRRHPDARWRLTEEDIARFAVLQRSILRRYAACVKPGGLLVYATCSLLAAENEAVADEFAAESPEFEPVRITGVPERALDSAGRLKVVPHVHGTDGFFAAAFRRVR